MPYTGFSLSVICCPTRRPPAPPLAPPICSLLCCRWLVSLGTACGWEGTGTGQPLPFVHGSGQTAPTPPTSTAAPRAVGPGCWRSPPRAVPPLSWYTGRTMGWMTGPPPPPTPSTCVRWSCASRGSTLWVHPPPSSAHPAPRGSTATWWGVRMRAPRAPAPVPRAMRAPLAPPTPQRYGVSLGSTAAPAVGSAARVRPGSTAPPQAWVPLAPPAAPRANPAPQALPRARRVLRGSTRWRVPLAPPPPVSPLTMSTAPSALRWGPS